MNIGFIGLGIMGKPMAAISSGQATRRPSMMLFPSAFLKQSSLGQPRRVSKDVAARSQVTFTMVPDGPEVEAAVLGKSGAWKEPNPVPLSWTLSSISPLVAQKSRRRVLRKGMSSWTLP